MTAPQTPIKIKLHPKQQEVFIHCKAKRRIIAKGRRWGFTRGASQYVILQLLSGVSPILWGDTIVSNIYNYFERYFLPTLSTIRKELWQWKKTEKKLFLNSSVCDFRSADQPENWEGFGYKLVVLNEAGIILNNASLWQNSVRPMLMDYPESVAIIGGTPKGRNLFWELHKTHKEGWESFTYDSYSNPHIKTSEIDELIADLPQSVVRQEIFAEFTDEASHVLITSELVDTAMTRERIAYEDGVEIWGLDIARHGDDFSVLAKRNYKRVHEVKECGVQDTMQLASFVMYELERAKQRPYRIFVEVTGMGWGVYDRLKELGAPVYPADVGQGSVMEKVLNKRAEMYMRLADALKTGLQLPEHSKLRKQLTASEFEFDSKSNLKLIAKEKIKKLIGESPDHADAVALTYYEDIRPFANKARPISRRKKEKTISWMAA